MNKRDLVIDSLEQCLQTPRCQDCGWKECESFECQQSPFPINLIYAALDFLKEQSWISVEDEMPEERETIFAKFRGTDKWNGNMCMRMSDDVRVLVEYDNGCRAIHHDHTVDGKWKLENPTHYPHCRVLYWMKNPTFMPEE